MPLSGAAELDVLSSAKKDRHDLKDLTGLDLTDAKKETDGVISNQLGVMVGLLLRLHYHTPKDSNLVGTFEPYTEDSLTDDSIKLLGSQQGRNIVGAHGGRVKEEPANGPNQMVIDSIPSLVNRQQNHEYKTRIQFHSYRQTRPDDDREYPQPPQS
ncbi:hypothetical protein FOXG_07681 [Fusarium oxysporum f. sp. lycopersici 4287]|uniref:Uncharacterized protein n=2 Tax=Fusarium oxysporum TaxID=5507 RepID=A0A0J9WME1_FUSO4|nr:hypothetical protein FOXG_07681 [Fusarium oxysporum f. sp. lycopersici 4287]EXK45880.1 hypothetical protein FOMG_04135 [Fusarium oxysporum f. sp. melonis 26406]KNB05372.1 hypothetical protein FOXG_07681 [Fusarium oxysporum f. sp. lycopersici 4287]